MWLPLSGKRCRNKIDLFQLIGYNITNQVRGNKTMTGTVLAVEGYREPGS